MSSKTKSMALILGSVIIGITILLLAVFAGAAWINSNPGCYIYRVSVENLSQYTGGPVTEIIVPVPMRDGELVFSEEDLQNGQSGNWKPGIVETTHGSMLVFRSSGDGNLTDIHAEFFRGFAPGEPTVTRIQNESLSPLTSKASGDSEEWKPDTEYISVVILPLNLTPLDPDAGEILIDLELSVSEGLSHSVGGDLFHVNILEQIPPEIRGEIPVGAQITKIDPSRRP